MRECLAPLNCTLSAIFAAAFTHSFVSILRYCSWFDDRFMRAATDCPFGVLKSDVEAIFDEYSNSPQSRKCTSVTFGFFRHVYRHICVFSGVLYAVYDRSSGAFVSALSAAITVDLSKPIGERYSAFVK